LILLCVERLLAVKADIQESVIKSCSMKDRYTTGSSR